MGNPIDILNEGKNCDGDLCYICRPHESSFVVVELMYVTSVCGKEGFALLATHTWVTRKVAKWKNVATNLMGIACLDWQPGSLQLVYST